MVFRKAVRILAPLLLVLVLAGGLATAPGLADEATPTATASSGVVRQVLDGGMPSAAPGEVLQLVRFTIAPGTKLPTHTHPGMQVAWLEAGTLHYTVVQGTVQIMRASGAGTPSATEMLTSGHSTDFQPGDRWVEPQGMVHRAENDGSTPVVILVASLLAAGQPPAQVVPVATP